MRRATVLFLLLLGVISHSPVAAALDSVNVSVAKLITGVNGRSSTWHGAVSDVWTDTYRKSDVTVTFKPIDATSGTWTSSPFDVFAPSELFAGGGPDFPYGEQGTWSGHYNIVGDLILASKLVSPNDESLGFGRTSLASVKGSELQLIDTSYLPSTVVVLRKR